MIAACELTPDVLGSPCGLFLADWKMGLAVLTTIFESVGARLENTCGRLSFQSLCLFINHLHVGQGSKWKRPVPLAVLAMSIAGKAAFLQQIVALLAIWCILCDFHC